MHVEMSLESQAAENSVSDEAQVAKDSPAISGSQVVAAFTHARGDSQKNTPSTTHTFLISMLAVISLVSLYLMFVLVL